MKVELRPIEKITPYGRNPRKIPAQAIDKVAASLQEFGWRQPIVIDEKGVIIVGHTRLYAAQKLGHAKVPVHVAKGLTPAQARAYRIADNRMGQDSEWDLDLLTVELDDLGDLDLTLTGFELSEIEGMRAAVAAAGRDSDPEAAPEPPEMPVATHGDLWALGRHRVLCGDATSAEDVARLLGGAKPHLMVTDPPYGVEYDPDWRNRADRANGKPYGATAIGQVSNDEQADWRQAWALFSGDVAYVWHADRHASTIQRSLEAPGFEIRSQIIWAKSRLIIGRGHYHWQHEPCWYAVRKGGRSQWVGDRSQTTLWSVEHMKSDTGHGTQKPIECMRRPIVNNSKPGDAVYDPFLGSGTTVIAAEMEGRRCYGLEIEPAYIDVIVRRWQNYTGQAAILEGDGKAFNEIAATRIAA